jgi:hypothetical protein
MARNTIDKTEEDAYSRWRMGSETVGRSMRAST